MKWKTAQVCSQVAEGKRLIEEARANCEHERILYTGEFGDHASWPTYGCVTCEAVLSYSEAEKRNFGRAAK